MITEIKEILFENLHQKIISVEPLSGGDINFVYKCILDNQTVVIKINDKEYIVSSVIEKEKFEQFFDVELNCPDVESLGGFVLKEFGHLPKVGESIKIFNLELIVTSADQRKIKKITVRKID